MAGLSLLFGAAIVFVSATAAGIANKAVVVGDGRGAKCSFKRPSGADCPTQPKPFLRGAFDESSKISTAAGLPTGAGADGLYKLSQKLSAQSQSTSPSTPQSPKAAPFWGSANLGPAFASFVPF